MHTIFGMHFCFKYFFKYYFRVLNCCYVNVRGNLTYVHITRIFRDSNAKWSRKIRLYIYIGKLLNVTVIKTRNVFRNFIYAIQIIIIILIANNNIHNLVSFRYLSKMLRTYKGIIKLNHLINYLYDFKLINEIGR